MAVYSILTGGFGSFGSINLIPTLGFSVASLNIIRRRQSATGQKIENDLTAQKIDNDLTGQKQSNSFTIESSLKNE